MSHNVYYLDQMLHCTFKGNPLLKLEFKSQMDYILLLLL